MIGKALKPRFGWLTDLTAGTLVKDTIAGLILAILLVPQAMAYAQLAGLPPQTGLFAALLPPLIYALFGTSSFVSMGPVALVSLVVAEAAANAPVPPETAAAVIAVEAIEGTDSAIRRAGSLCRRGGFTVVKVAKPQQDRRFDVPTVGLDTVQTMYEAGARVLAIESQRTILLDGDDSITLANRLGIAIVALNAEELQLRVAS